MSDLPPRARRRPTEDEIRSAVARFDQLVRDGASEPDLQKFLGKHPYLFSLSLPLRLEPWHIIPRGRDFEDEADFVFFDQSDPARSYGVIELKRPDHKILTRDRRRIITLSRNADLAVKQAQVYGRRLEAEILSAAEFQTCLALGNRSSLFVIMGLTRQVASGLLDEIDELQLRALLPAGIRIVPYDELLHRLESGLPRVLVLREANQRNALPLPPILPRSIEITTQPGVPFEFRIPNYGGPVTTASIPPDQAKYVPPGVTVKPAPDGRSIIISGTIPKRD